MFKRLVVLILLASAIVSVSTPAQAATLYVDMGCIISDGGLYTCEAYAGGGTAPYTSYRWKIQGGGTTQYVTGPSVYDGYCARPNRLYTITVTVTDSRGATASDTAGFYCMV